MKSNLKNFPKYRMQGLQTYHMNVRKWTEGFEAELREMLKDRDDKTGFYVPRPDGWKKAIKEILGE